MTQTNTQTYTGNLGAIENKISGLTSAVSKGYSGLPGITEALRKSLYEREKTMPGLERDVEGKITELYTADKRMAERYANPESGMYIENPMNRQALMSGQKADIRGEYGNVLNLIQSRQNVIGSALDKGLELYKAGLSAQEFELTQAEKQWERMWKIQESKKGAGKTAAATAASTAVQKLIMTLTSGALVDENTERFYVGKQAEQNPEHADAFWEAYNTFKQGGYTPKKETETEWNTKQTLIKNAAAAKSKNGATPEELRQYILEQGFNPDDPDFTGLYE